MNDVSNRAVREFSEFLDSVEKNFPKPTCTTAYEITMKSTIVSALITLDTEKQMDERFWNHLRVQRNILDFLYSEEPCYVWSGSVRLCRRGFAGRCRTAA